MSRQGRRLATGFRNLLPLGLMVVVGFLTWGLGPPASAVEAGARVALMAIPEPDLGPMDPAAAEQIRAAAERLGELRRTSGVLPAALGEAFGELGRLYQAYELYAPAEACYRNALALQPGAMRWRYLLAVAYQSMARWAEAAEALRAVVEAYPQYLAAWVRLGDVLLRDGDTEGARRAYLRAYEVVPEDASVLARLGELAYADGHYLEAVVLLGGALRRQPAANRLHYPLAMAYRALGEGERARAHLARRGTVGVDPADPIGSELKDLQRGERILVLQGKLAFRAGRFAEAEEAFRKAVTEEPQSAGARVNLGTALARLGRMEEATTEFREAVRLDPGNATARYNLGILLARAGALNEAVDHLDAAANAESGDAQAWLDLADTQRALGRFDDALLSYQQAAKTDNSLGPAWVGQASLLIRRQDYREALNRLEWALLRVPENGQIAHALARTLAACPDPGLRDGGRSLELAAKVYQAAPFARHAETLAMAYAESGDCERAAETQAKALELARGEDASENRLKSLESMQRYYENSRPCRVPPAKIETPP